MTINEKYYDESHCQIVTLVDLKEFISSYNNKMSWNCHVKLEDGSILNSHTECLHEI